MLNHNHGTLLHQRRTGILLHPTSLPGRQHKGDLGQEARNFIHFMQDCGLTVWQVLPLGPTHVDDSPYQCLSTHAGNHELINLDWLAGHGWLDLQHLPQRIDQKTHEKLLHEAAQRFFQSADAGWLTRLEAFIEENNHWLADYVLYVVLRRANNDEAWTEWPAALRERDAQLLKQARDEHAGLIKNLQFIQFVFFTQWTELREYAAQRGIILFGDMPIYVSMDSADVWAARVNFLVDDEGETEFVAGVPPDAFSASGQLWGNPLFDWDAMQALGFNWWVDRMRTHLKLYDYVRIDHFRALESFWQIPAQSATAIDGEWVDSPGRLLLACLHDHFDPLPIVAEDLGLITDAVRELRDEFHLPGMKVLQFAFDGDHHNEHLPHNHRRNSVVYPGTHDNDTTLGWYQTLQDYQRNLLRDYLGRPDNEMLEMPWLMNRVALASVANLAILPMQDLLCLGSEHRMNVPGTMLGNWSWRFDWHQVWPSLHADLRALVYLYGRA